MIYKARTESPELKLLKALKNRYPSPITNQTYYTLNKGYVGEVLFDQLIEKLTCPCLVLNDLLLQVNNQTFQVDALMILSNQIHVFEVKNLEGDYFYEKECFFPRNKPGNEISNPLLQLERATSLLRQLLQKLDFPISIQSSVIFINPKFVLYQAPMDKPILFANQLDRFIQKFNSIQTPLGKKQQQLAAKLLSLNENETPYKRLPTYQYQDLRKGITCSACHSFSVEVQHSKCICSDCGFEEKVKAAVLRSVEEFKMLFPDEKITTNRIYEWCKIIACKKKVQRILSSNYKKVGVHQWSYYE
ncbi:nuclease-related domain-containing protein [Ureibacillus chungkukjangi]|uniref:Nuclease-like protein n=1 Tax=Ureibacillus chungkukjangi TaxID=1202712 RepID=A0A318TN98_9BACL|nr:nuclease-related domain-containing protein [Ureibacillus chungkukjangi]PYF06074.1 nuclease-like protein [Ureibacillus chungkukjangi]